MNHTFDVEEATKHGLEKAILLSNLRFWLTKNKANEANDNEGYYWTYNSSTAFSKLFPYMKTRSIRKWLNDLEKEGVIKSGNFNKSAYDRTKWYTIPNEFKVTVNPLAYDANQSANNANQSAVNCQPIPDINTDINTEEEEKENTPPPFVLENRKKAKQAKKAYEERVNFKDAENPISELEAFINTNLIDKLNKYPSFSRMKHKEEFIKDFSKNAITRNWIDSDDLTLHISRSMTFFKPKELPKVKRASVKYVYKINGSEFRHSDTKKFEMDKRNFTGYGFEEIRVKH